MINEISGWSKSLIFLSTIVHGFTWVDWLAFASCWPALALYTALSDRHGVEAECLNGASRRARRGWAESAARRPLSGRMLDASILGTLNNSAVFFASSALLGLGAFLSLTVSPDRIKDAIDAMGVVGMASRDTHLVVAKAAVAGGFFGWSFLKFTWSMRQIAFAASLCGSLGESGEDPEDEERKIGSFADLASLAGESFNLGLRSFYWSMAACCWLLSPWLCIACSGALAYGLWHREFRSETLRALQKAHPPLPGRPKASVASFVRYWSRSGNAADAGGGRLAPPKAGRAEEIEVAARDN